MIALVPYDPEWARRFEAERSLLERVLAPWLEGGVEHVGSTAIPGVSAKPIVDMIAAEYEALKLRLARGHTGDVRTYTDGKREFVRGVLVAAGVEFSWR